MRRSSSAISLITALLCRTFSTSGGSWRCDPTVDAVSPGPVVLYTRIKSPRDAVSCIVGTAETPSGNP
jgi:hypothetical protein